MDLNVQTFRLVQEAISDAAPNRAKQAASRKGGIKNGKSRAKSISPARRTEIARKANAARWNKTKTA